MRRRTRRISYIKKPFARKSFVSIGFLLAALLCAAASFAISVSFQGNGDVEIAAWGLSSMIFTVVSLVYAVSSFLEKEMNYLLAKISLAVSGLLLALWLGVLVLGFLG